jgi:signal peptidase I
MIKQRRPNTALLLSVMPGLGQIYNGELRKGLIILGIDLLFPILFALSGILLYMSGLIAMVVVAILLLVYRMADGFIIARRSVNYEVKPFNRWYYYLLFAISTVVIRMFLDAPTSTGIQTFKIPTPSMIPTLQPGDKVVAKLMNFNRDKIDYGDIVIFNSPRGGIWTFRVIGLPKDSVEIQRGGVYVNGQLNQMNEMRGYVSDGQEVVEFEETLKNNKKIKTLRFKTPIHEGTREMEKKFVPENEYFLMGDHRDNALDSRFLGTIRKDDILGQVIYTYWGNNSDRININLRLN